MNFSLKQSCFCHLLSYYLSPLDRFYLACFNSGMNKFSGDMLRGHLEALVLATLEAGEAHGYEVMQRLNGEARGAFHMREGALYPVLYRLEEQGLLATRWEKEDAPRKGPRRRLYRLTSKGKRALGQHRITWRSFVATLGPILEGTT